MAETREKTFRIEVENEGQSARLIPQEKTLDAAVTREDIVAEAIEQGICVDDTVRETIETLLEQLRQGEAPDGLVVARGFLPVADKPGHLEKLFQINTCMQEDEEGLEQDQEQGFYDCSTIITTKKGQALLRIVPVEPGKNGRDVRGNELPRKLATDAKVKLGPNVEQQEDVILATENGQILFDGTRISVNTRLEIHGDVDFSVGNIDFDGEVVVAKNVLDRFHIKSRATIAIHGIAEAAEIEAGEDLIVTGGIAGKEKGVFRAGKNLEAKYIANATLRIGEDIRVYKEIVNCDLACGGKLTIENGSLMGGTAVARGGVAVKEIGSEMGVQTLLEVGMDHRLKEIWTNNLPQIELLRQKSAKVRQVVEPLLANQKSLNAQQKEEATELLYQSYELDDNVASLIDEIRQTYESATELTISEVEVTAIAYHGVRICFPRVETTLETEFKGPIKFAPLKEKGELRVVVIDSASGSTHALRSRIDPDNFWAKLEKLIEPES
jgi:hypothetical protein